MDQNSDLQGGGSGVSGSRRAARFLPYSLKQPSPVVVRARVWATFTAGAWPLKHSMAMTISAGVPGTAWAAGRGQV